MELQNSVTLASKVCVARSGSGSGETVSNQGEGNASCHMFIDENIHRNRGRQRNHHRKRGQMPKQPSCRYFSSKEGLQVQHSANKN